MSIASWLLATCSSFNHSCPAGALELERHIAQRRLLYRSEERGPPLHLRRAQLRASSSGDQQLVREALGHVLCIILALKVERIGTLSLCIGLDCSKPLLLCGHGSLLGASLSPHCTERIVNIMPRGAGKIRMRESVLDAAFESAAKDSERSAV